MYREVLDNPIGNIFLAACKYHEFLISHRNTALHTSIESRRSSQNYVDNPNLYTTSNMPLPSSDPSDLLHLTYYDRKRRCSGGISSLIKIALWNTIHNVNFLHSAITRKAQEALMCETNIKAKYIRTKYSVWTEPLYFEWVKFIPMLEKYFPDILDEMLNCHNQMSASANGEATSSFRLNHTNIGRILSQTCSRLLKPRNRGWAQHCSSFCHSTPEVSHSHHQNVPNTNPTGHKSNTFKYTTDTSACESNNQYHLADKRTLQPEPLITHLPHSNQQQQYDNANMHLSDQETVSTEQLKSVNNSTGLLASVMVEQPIIQAAISSTETSDGTKKFESSIMSVRNAAQISGQYILGIAFSKMVGSPFTSACRLRDCLPHVTWDNLKKWALEGLLNNTILQSCHTSFCPSATRPQWDTLLLFYIVLVNFCWRFIIWQTCLKFWLKD